MDSLNYQSKLKQNDDTIKVNFYESWISLPCFFHSNFCMLMNGLQAITKYNLLLPNSRFLMIYFSSEITRPRRRENSTCLNALMSGFASRTSWQSLISVVFSRCMYAVCSCFYHGYHFVSKEIKRFWKFDKQNWRLWKCSCSGTVLLQGNCVTTRELCYY